MNANSSEKISTPDFEVRFTASERCVFLQGSLRLNAAPEYEPIAELMESALQHVASSGQSILVVDLRALKFLNSSGINLLYQFVLKVKKIGNVGLRVLGSSSNAWQPKSLSNMVKFMPAIELEIA
jgi:hypothetical protein